MCGSSQPRMLLTMARKDLRAMKAIAASDLYDNETFGFHAQQAVEKALKAWLCMRNVEYPPTHNLRSLIALLQDSGAETADLWRFVDLIPFAVQFRYGAYEDMTEEHLDTADLTAVIATLLDTIEGMLQAER